MNEKGGRIVKVVNAAIPSFEVIIDLNEKLGSIRPIILYATADDDIFRSCFFPMSAGADGTVGMSTGSDLLGICYDYGEYQLFDFSGSSGDIPLMQYIFNKCKGEKTTVIDIENCKAFRDYDEDRKQIEKLTKDREDL